LVVDSYLVQDTPSPPDSQHVALL